MWLFDEASRIVLEQAHFLGAERVGLNEAANRILAEDVSSDISMPPFDKSAMDGYACRMEDLDGELTVLEIISAGEVPRKRVGKGECAKIMTGTIVPEGADCVVQVEHTERTTKGMIRVTRKSGRHNICRRGEDIKEGDNVLCRSERIRPQHIAVLASAGHITPLVARRPVVAVIPTGNELVEPGRKPGVSQIRNSNGYQLCAQIMTACAIPHPYGIAADTEEALDGVIKQAADKSDVMLITGGVSMGDSDLVPGILEKNGIRLLFEKVAVKPGMPTVFGVSDSVFCFGLPGNPVSTFVIFEIIVKPFLFKLMGHDFRPRVVPMKLAENIERKAVERDMWIPVKQTETGDARAIKYHGSAHINALTLADGLICMPRGVAEIRKGISVDVRQI